MSQGQRLPVLSLHVPTGLTVLSCGRYSTNSRVVRFVNAKSVGLRLTGGNDVGIFVSSVQEGSLADSQGVREGDQILQVSKAENAPYAAASGPVPAFLGPISPQGITSRVTVPSPTLPWVLLSLGPLLVPMPSVLLAGPRANAFLWQVNDTSFQNLTREEAVEYLMALPPGEEVTLWIQSKQDSEW